MVKETSGMTSDLPPKPAVEAPGLVWQPRRRSWTPYWRVPEWYTPETKKYRNLSPLADNPEALIARCNSMTAEAARWKAGARGHVGSFDNTLDYYIKKYANDADSPLWDLRPGSRKPYEYYLQKLSAEVGSRRVDKLTGIDLKRWHEVWSDGGRKLAASKMIRAVLDAVLAYGVMAHSVGTVELRAASELRTILSAAKRKLPNPKRREFTVSADDVVRLRESAHKDGRKSHALAYALVFETTLRLWDVIGQWVPLDTPGISDIVMEPHTSMKEAKKWFGLRWEDINGDMVLHYVPTKTSKKTGLAVTFPLHMAPMVVEEFCWWPEPRKGPVIVNGTSGLPYSANYFGEGWRRDREAAGIPTGVWARDLRASGITEAREAGVATDDLAKVAGHASTKTTSAVYDRGALAAAERTAEGRKRKRAK